MNQLQVTALYYQIIYVNNYNTIMNSCERRWMLPVGRWTLVEKLKILNKLTSLTVLWSNSLQHHTSRCQSAWTRSMSFTKGTICSIHIKKPELCLHANWKGITGNRFWKWKIPSLSAALSIIYTKALMRSVTKAAMYMCSSCMACNTTLFIAEGTANVLLQK